MNGTGQFDNRRAAPDGTAERLGARLPRLGLGLAATLFSLLMVLGAFDVPVADLNTAGLSPVQFYWTVDREAHRAYARGTRFVSDLRLFFEINARLRELEAEAASPDSAPSTQASSDGGGNTYRCSASATLPSP